MAKLTPGRLDADQKALYDAIAGGPRSQGPQLFRLTDDEGALEGPFNGFLLQPRLGAALQAVGASVRYETSLSDRCREVAILVVAAHWGSDFEQYAHEAVGRHVGLTDEDVAAISERRYATLPDDERVVAAAALSLAADGDLDDESYAAVVALLGEPGLFELLTLVGYYAALALQLRVLRVAAPR